MVAATLGQCSSRQSRGKKEAAGPAIVLDANSQKLRPEGPTPAGLRPRSRCHPELPASSWDSKEAEAAHQGTGNGRILYLREITSLSSVVRGGRERNSGEVSSCHHRLRLGTRPSLNTYSVPGRRASMAHIC